MTLLTQLLGTCAIIFITTMITGKAIYKDDKSWPVPHDLLLITSFLCCCALLIALLLGLIWGMKQ